MDTAKVVIIGAGPSAIASATRLLELGFQKVHLVEAENRIGGRINTIPFADNVVDLGAQWCHGEKDNIVYQLASKHNLLEATGDLYEGFDNIRSNKELLSKTVSKRLRDVVENIYFKKTDELLTYKGSQGSYLISKYYEALRKPENSDIDMEIAKEFLANNEKMLNSLEASDTLTDVSCKSSIEFWDSEGDFQLNWKDKGYLEFLRLLMKSRELDNELGVLSERVRLGKPVKQILWNGESKVQVKCVDGEVIEADHVISTVSLGVLKEKHSTLFEPNLPAEKVRAIEGLAFGTVDKIYLQFAAPFWPDSWSGCGLLWREEDLSEIRGTERAWLEDLYCFNRVSHQPKILCGWISGVNARHMETLPKEEILDGCMYLLRKFLKWDIPAPVAIKSTAWHKNENFRGSYSYYSMLTEELNTNNGDLATPLINADQKPVLLFAGEATSDHHFSTVHGAVETGFREAERLAKYYDDIKLKIEN